MSSSIKEAAELLNTLRRLEDSHLSEQATLDFARATLHRKFSDIIEHELTAQAATELLGQFGITDSSSGTSDQPMVHPAAVAQLIDTLNGYDRKKALLFALERALLNSTGAAGSADRTARMIRLAGLVAGAILVIGVVLYRKQHRPIELKDVARLNFSTGETGSREYSSDDEIKFDTTLSPEFTDYQLQFPLHRKVQSLRFHPLTQSCARIQLKRIAIYRAGQELWSRGFTVNNFGVVDDFDHVGPAGVEMGNSKPGEDVEVVTEGRNPYIDFDLPSAVDGIDRFDYTIRVTECWKDF